MSDSIYKLNAMEFAAQATNPAGLGYAEKRCAVLSYVDGIERELARYQQAEKELPEPQRFNEDGKDRHGPYVFYDDYAELRAHAARLAAELAASRKHPQLSRGLSNHGADYTALIERVRKIDPDAAEYMAGPAHKLSGFSPQKHLDAAFIWSKTPQGRDYWEQINGLLYIQLTESAANFESALPQSEIDKAGEVIAFLNAQTLELRLNPLVRLTTPSTVVEMPEIPLSVAAPAALPDGRNEARKAISEPLSISMEQVERLGEAHHTVLTILDELVCAVDGMDSLDEHDEEYGPALERLDKAVEAARPYTEKAMLAAQGDRK